jgi:hypothetical protein
MPDICWSTFFFWKKQEKKYRKMHKNAKKSFQNFPLFSTHDAFKNGKT